ncbi:MAG: hypothetical protein U5K55_05760 [Aliarcobacter sp.]|nr:hypothetical protein [Aliarcobacter sp.]
MLKGKDGVFYRTKNDLTVSSISNLDIPSNAISASIYETSSGTLLYLYANSNMELKGSSNFLNCKQTSGTNCNSS